MKGGFDIVTGILTGNFTAGLRGLIDLGSSLLGCYQK